MKNTNIKVWAGIGLAASIHLTGCSSDGTGNSEDTLQSRIDWTSCHEDSLECATLSVPMDYSEPDGESIDVALIRHVASNDVAMGSLLLNPGGPGGSGVDLLREFIDREGFPETITHHYNIVGFDPRGIGDSTPVDCSEFGINDFNEYPLDEAEIIELHEEHINFANACFEKYGSYLQQLGSLNVVRDMDEIRIAMGEQEISFIGYSYGTRLAALYLQEFPANSGRFVLDGSMHPVSAVTKLVEDGLPVLHSNLTNVLTNCVSLDPACDVNALHTRLNDQIRTLIQDESRSEELDFLGELILMSVSAPELGEFASMPIIRYLNSGDVAELESFYQTLLELGVVSDEDEESEDESEDNTTAQIAILCADDAERHDIDFLTTKYREFNRVSDLFAELQITNLALCSGWAEAIEPLPPIVTGTAPVSLVIGGTTDAQTPLQWSDDMAQAIGGLFIRSEHPGHTSVFNEESACIDAMVEAFLIDGTTPTETFCSE